LTLVVTATGTKMLWCLWHMQQWKRWEICRLFKTTDWRTN